MGNAVLYQYLAHIFNIGTYSHTYTSICTTLVHSTFLFLAQYQVCFKMPNK